MRYYKERIQRIIDAGGFGYAVIVACVVITVIVLALVFKFEPSNAYLWF